MIRDFFFASFVAWSFVCAPVVAQDASEQNRELIRVVARRFDPFGTADSADVTFRSVALKMPWVYALDRDGNLHIFEVPRERLKGFSEGLQQAIYAILFGAQEPAAQLDSPKRLRFAQTITNAGDGNDLEIVGSVLTLTRMGNLEVYSIEHPSAPTYLGRFGPKTKLKSQSIVPAGKLAFVVGKGCILTYDMVNPTKPRHIATLNNDFGNWNGCSEGKFLYITEYATTPHKRRGIAVYDTSNAKQLTERHFIATSQTPYHIFVNRENHLVACLGSGSRWHIVSAKNITVNGKTAVFKLGQSGAPELHAEIKGSGGRAATSARYRGATYLICNGLVFSSKSEVLRKAYSFFPYGSTLDGSPYHGGSDGAYAALATDQDICILRIGRTGWTDLGRHAAICLTFSVLACIFFQKKTPRTKT